MKNIHIILFTVFLNLAFYSCTPSEDIEESNVPQACCGEGDDIPPPPPTGD